MSRDLIAFLKAWYDWATSGAPDGEPFDRDVGLCDNICERNPGASGEEVRKELAAALGGKMFPFGFSSYCNREVQLTQHECPKRLAWVRARLVEAGELVS